MRIFYKILFLMSLCFSSKSSFASDGFDSFINAWLSPISNKIAGTVFYSFSIAGADIKIIVLWLIAGSIFCTFYFNFINLRMFSHALDLVRGRYDKPESKGEVSHFQALSTALSGTVGLGNIAGVAVAISIGGPGATFWMILAGFLGMSLKFCECTLGVKYRVINSDGTVSGGPMHYLSKGLAEKGKATLGKILAVFFSICCIGGALGGGNMFQANQSFQQFVSVTGGQTSFFADKGWLFGLIIAVILGVVIIGGIKSIAKVTSTLVPLMALIYLFAGLIIILLNIGGVPEAILSIISEAFSPTAAAGGALGALIIGFQRAAFSNEAGLGSAPIAHAAVKTDIPVTEGLVSLLEPFIDTIIICTITALVIVLTGVYVERGDLAGIALTSAAFAKTIPWFPYILALAAILFAFSTMIAWSYYGLKSWCYLFGNSVLSENIFKFIFCAFVIIGSSVSLGSVLDISDSMIFLMSVANLVGVYFLAGVVKKEINEYMKNLSNGNIKKTDVN
ncbi:MAG: alanine glycine permease [Pelagibacterales bacterium]|nr:alanine glycine permease [Pelagibacterales bacterium]|tara:strand:+ start:1683 stop:3203 length:1521 start_codon:yes stop_codon:yes gene_type:complete